MYWSILFYNFELGWIPELYKAYSGIRKLLHCPKQPLVLVVYIQLLMVYSMNFILLKRPVSTVAIHA